MKPRGDCPVPSTNKRLPCAVWQRATVEQLPFAYRLIAEAQAQKINKDDPVEGSSQLRKHLIVVKAGRWESVQTKQRRSCGVLVHQFVCRLCGKRRALGSSGAAPRSSPTYIEDVVIFVLKIVALILPLKENRRIRWCRVVGEDGQHNGHGHDQPADHIGLPAHFDLNLVRFEFGRNPFN